jgi:hypothetical protein
VAANALEKPTVSTVGVKVSSNLTNEGKGKYAPQYW